MITVGEILKNRRLERKLTLEQAEKATKIRAKFLSWLEDNKFEGFSSPITARGFVRNYALFLGLPLDRVMAFYRRQEEKTALVLPKVRSFGRGPKITPPVLSFLGISVMLLIFLAFLAYQFFLFAAAPELAVTDPLENSVVSEEVVKVAGKTDNRALITINNEPVKVQDNGQFETLVPVTAGINTITIQATNRFQRTTTVTQHVRLEKP